MTGRPPVARESLDDDAALQAGAAAALAYARTVDDRPVMPAAAAVEALRAFAEPLPEEGRGALDTLRLLDAVGSPATMASAGRHYFGFVIGATHPASLASAWLADAWDQNAALPVMSPVAAALHDVTARWLVELLHLPVGSGVAFVSGATVANAACLAAGRDALLERMGWDVQSDGLFGAPELTGVVGERAHSTLSKSLGLVGLGRRRVVVVPSDDQGRLRAAELPDLAGPVLVCAQAGEVNSGAIDPLAEICDVAHAAGAWVHVDGAFGLWAAASPSLRPELAGVERADSWATDFHKWLNVPYDSGFVACADSGAHRAAMGVRAAYLMHADDDPAAARDQVDWNPEFSRRARGFAVYAALQSLGRRGVAELVERCCDCARQFAERLDRIDRVEVLNDVTLDQVLVRFRAGSATGDPDPGADDAVTRRVVDAVQASGECWMSGTTWRGRAAMRISVVNWQTTEADVDRSVAAVERALASA